MEMGDDGGIEVGWSRWADVEHDHAVILCVISVSNGMRCNMLYGMCYNRPLVCPASTTWLANLPIDRGCPYCCTSKSNALVLGAARPGAASRSGATARRVPAVCSSWRRVGEDDGRDVAVHWRDVGRPRGAATPRGVMAARCGATVARIVGCWGCVGGSSRR